MLEYNCKAEKSGVLRRLGKNHPEIASDFCLDKFALQTCLFTATSHFITKWRKKPIGSHNFLLGFLRRFRMDKLTEFKRETLKALVKSEWETEKDCNTESKSKEQVELKKEPNAISMRILKDDTDYETQIMAECNAFFEKHGIYPNAVVMNPMTIERWEARIEDNAAESEVDDYLEHMTFAQIKEANTQKGICEIGPSEDGKATLFKTPDYELFIIENEEYQDGVYQLFNGYSPILDNGSFSFPVINMVETGKKIRELADEKGIKPTDIQKVCGLGSLQAVYKWFSGKSVPTIDNLGIISNLLNTPIDDIVVFENRKE